ncbi:hypothetical protein [Pseudoruegeria sp. SK021]|nr:hypothetical protein [Pseudoruegeria sp. SK021]
MSKGNNQKGNKEAKKPKQVKAKAPLAAAPAGGKSGLVVAGKKIK